MSSEEGSVGLSKKECRSSSFKTFPLSASTRTYDTLPDLTGASSSSSMPHSYVVCMAVALPQTMILQFQFIDNFSTARGNKTIKYAPHSLSIDTLLQPLKIPVKAVQRALMLGSMKVRPTLREMDTASPGIWTSHHALIMRSVLSYYTFAVIFVCHQRHKLNTIFTLNENGYFNAIVYWCSSR